MDETRANFKNTPLSTVDSNVIKPTNDNNSFNEVEEQRFTTYNPLLSNSIKFKRMYWSSKIEVIARLLVLLVSCLHLFFAYYFANNLVNKIFALSNNMTLSPNYIIYIFLIFMFGFNLLLYLPMAIGRSASAIFGWSIVYIVLAIVYFIFLELVCTILLVVNGLVSQDVAIEVPLFMFAVLLITILWLVASCLLIVKSDDVRRELSVE